MVSLPILNHGIQTLICTGLILCFNFFSHVLYHELAHICLDLLLVNLSFVAFSDRIFFKNLNV